MFNHDTITQEKHAISRPDIDELLDDNDEQR
jgi:hypothetical protein